MMLPPVYIRAQRIRSTRVDDRGVLVEGAPHEDRWSLIYDGGEISAWRGLTVATHTIREHAPVMLPGWYPDSLAAGLHDGDPALRFEGRVAPRYRRGSTVRQDWRAHLLIHDYAGRSDGCLTAPQWWIDATIAALHRLARTPGWRPWRRPDDARWTVGLLLEEPP